MDNRSNDDCYSPVHETAVCEGRLFLWTNAQLTHRKSWRTPCGLFEVPASAIGQLARTIADVQMWSDGQCSLAMAND